MFAINFKLNNYATSFRTIQHSTPTMPISGVQYYLPDSAIWLKPVFIHGLDITIFYELRTGEVVKKNATH